MQKQTRIRKLVFRLNEFEKLKKNNLLECIYCNSKKVIKSIMSPRVVNQKENKVDFISIEDLRSKKESLKNPHFNSCN